jgi:AGCS family alanine or glycine:cation symporter
VATAITLGGPGALFWMWITALFGMATKYAEAVCAVHFREQDGAGHYSGGPMYYIRNGLKPHWHWLAFAFAIFGSLAGFGIANTVQSNSISQVLNDTYGVVPIYTGLALMVLVGAVVLGGIQRISTVAGYLVPLMASSYLLMGIVIVITLNITAVPGGDRDHRRVGLHRLGGGGGICRRDDLGCNTLRRRPRHLLQRGRPRQRGDCARRGAHREPVQQGMVAMLGTFIDTLVVCSITGLVIVIMDVIPSGCKRRKPDFHGVRQCLPRRRDHRDYLGLCLFGFTTMIGWSFYGERCVVFLVGTRGILPFRLATIFSPIPRRRVSKRRTEQTLATGQGPGLSAVL